MRTVRYRTALGSARETLACLRVAEAFGYVHAVPDGVVDRMNPSSALSCVSRRRGCEGAVRRLRFLACACREIVA
jgi:hypothetical protein